VTFQTADQLQVQETASHNLHRRHMRRTNDHSQDAGVLYETEPVYTTKSSHYTPRYDIT